MSTCCAGVCGCCKWDVDVTVGLALLLGVGKGFEFPLALGMLALACDSRPLDGNVWGPVVVGALGVAIAPGACVDWFCENDPMNTQSCLYQFLTLIIESTKIPFDCKMTRLFIYWVRKRRPYINTGLLSLGTWIDIWRTPRCMRCLIQLHWIIILWQGTMSVTSDKRNEISVTGMVVWKVEKFQ